MQQQRLLLMFERMEKEDYSAHNLPLVAIRRGWRLPSAAVDPPLSSAVVVANHEHSHLKQQKKSLGRADAAATP